MKKKATLKKPTLADVDKFAVRPSEGPGGDKNTRAGVSKGKTAPVAPNAPESSSGKVPAGDVRLSANINQELHLKLKIAAAKERTTIGEILERLVDEHLD